MVNNSLTRGEQHCRMSEMAACSSQQALLEEAADSAQRQKWMLRREAFLLVQGRYSMVQLLHLPHLQKVIVDFHHVLCGFVSSPILA